MLLSYALLCLLMVIATTMCSTCYREACSLDWTGLAFHIESTAKLPGLQPLVQIQASWTALLCSMLAEVCCRSVEARDRLSPCLRANYIKYINQIKPVIYLYVAILSTNSEFEHQNQRKKSLYYKTKHIFLYAYYLL
jgi:hypothetical protein